MPTRGYPSLLFLHAAAAEIEAANVPTFIYYFGDHDPSGIDIPVKVEEGLRDFAPSADITFQRLAVLPGQIIAWDLPTRPTKQSDTRAKNFHGESVEVDAIPPLVLRELCADAIEAHIPDGVLEELAVVEAEERKVIQMFKQQVE